MKCVECGEPVDIKAGDMIEGIGMLAEGYEWDLCRKCLTKGWTYPLPQDFKNDGLHVDILSPIQPWDLW